MPEREESLETVGACAPRAPCIREARRRGGMAASERLHDFSCRDVEMRVPAKHDVLRETLNHNAGLERTAQSLDRLVTVTALERGQQRDAVPAASSERGGRRKVCCIPLRPFSPDAQAEAASPCLPSQSGGCLRPEGTTAMGLFCTRSREMRLRFTYSPRTWPLHGAFNVFYCVLVSLVLTRRRNAYLHEYLRDGMPLVLRRTTAPALPLTIYQFGCIARCASGSHS
ncbi:hypothetical protein NA57DRAFT_60052 [Rhizodiscina lignyota]|uniref:Uncharacterized protein n=1 Tax=Rhizodiscina lignyota TaxID=1504668 RepID=A0A9P4I8W4_9PEZI|nr:hypothetical protein NA57DRAFT_60052 [Rhizodiscina lignyota]